MRLATQKEKEWVRVFMITTIILLFAILVIYSRLIYVINDFILRCGMMGETLTASIFLVLYIVLWMNYRRWRQIVARKDELEDILAAISVDVLLVVDVARNIMECSGGVEKMFGYTPDELFGQKTDLLYFDRRTEPKRPFEIHEILEKQGFHIGLATGKKKTGETITLEIVTGNMNNRVGAVLLLRDITERKRVEDALRASHRFLQIANRHTAMPSLLKDFLAEVKSFTRCAAAGIRMADGKGAFPYQIHDSLDEKLYECQNALTMDSSPCVPLDVIKGTTDPARPFHTEEGSFYLNNASELLDTLPEEERERLRRVSTEFGYESVAMVPIRVGKDILGLIHVADKQTEKLPLQTVEVLEDAATELGMASQRMKS